MLQQSSRRADDDVAFGHAFALKVQVFAADDQAGREVMVLAHLLQLLKDLVGQLSGGRDDQGAETVRTRPAKGEETF